MTADEVLRKARSFLLVDWPSREVPETLARAGYAVVSHDGPAPEDYNAYELDGDDVVSRNVGAPPEHADVVYSHRPDDELAAIIEHAKPLGVTAVWCETPSAEAQRIVEAAALVYADAPIIDTVRARHRMS